MRDIEPPKDIDAIYYIFLTSFACTAGLNWWFQELLNIFHMTYCNFK